MNFGCDGAARWRLRLANGDTFHTTNCTPQVAGFNQSNHATNWGATKNGNST